MPGENPYQSYRMRSIFSQPPPQRQFRNPFVSGPSRMDEARSELFQPRDMAFRDPRFQELGEPDDGSQYFDEIMNVRNSAGPGLSAYRQALQERPNPEDHKPGWFTRIASGLSGFGAGMRDAGEGIRVAQDLNQSGYRRAMEDYGTRLGTLKESADIEQAEAENTIKAIAQARALGLKYDEFKLKQEEALHKRNMDSYNAESTRMTAGAAVERAKAYAQQLGRPDYNYEPQQDGSLLAINKNNPADRKIIPAKTIASAQLKVNQSNAQSNRISAEASRTNAQTNSSRGEQYKRNVDSLIKYRDSRTTPGGKPNSPQAQKTATDLALEKMFMNPEFRQFVNFDGGYYDAADPEDFDPEEYELFVEELNDLVKTILAGGGQ